MRIRKQSAAIVLLASVMLLGGCRSMDVIAVQSGLKENPYYQLGDTWWEHGGIEEYYFNQVPSSLNEIYRELYERIRDGQDEAALYAAVGLEDFWTAYYSVLADHPEFFWVGSNIEVQQSALSGNVVSYSLSVTVPPEQREDMRIRLEQAADECIAGIPEGATEYQKIKAIYEYLIDTTDYDSSSPDNQNIQSALLNHRSVCAGYSRAFQYILHRMGMFCTYVTGSIVTGGDHGWNIVRIGENYYNVDVTWGDPVFAGAADANASRLMNYNYLCCTDAELYRTHVPDVDVPLPSCTDESLNYYRLNGMYYEYFDYDAVYDALMNSVWNDQNSVTMKFGTAEAYESAKYELFSNGMLSDAAGYLMEIYGTRTWNYSYNTDDEFCVITIYWH